MRPPLDASMPSPAFSELVSRLIEAMGQQMSTVRTLPEGFLLVTGDGFRYAFLEDPAEVSLGSIERLLGEAGDRPQSVAVLTPGHLPLALGEAVRTRGGSVIDGARFAELARGLDLGSFLGDEPRAPPVRPHPRLLPSALQLEEAMRRARNWFDWGVPILALRFYRHALASKPDFGPARIGVGRSLLALGLLDEADRAFDEILAFHPGDVEARLGKAAVLGGRGRTGEEVRAYRAMLDEGVDRLEVRASLLAALVADGRWADAREEVERILSEHPEDPQFRFLHAVTLWRTAMTEEGDRERDRARAFGLPFDRERSLSEHLGLPPPTPPSGGGAPAPREAGERPAPKTKPPAPRRGRPRPRAAAPPKRRRKAK